MQCIVSAFPADLPAAIFVVVHTAAGYESALPEILSKCGPLKATHAILPGFAAASMKKRARK